MCKKEVLTGEEIASKIDDKNNEEEEDGKNSPNICECDEQTFY